MKSVSMVKIAASLALSFVATAAFAHAQLQKATPPVGQKHLHRTHDWTPPWVCPRPERTASVCRRNMTTPSLECGPALAASSGTRKKKRGKLLIS